MHKERAKVNQGFVVLLTSWEWAEVNTYDIVKTPTKPQYVTVKVTRQHFPGDICPGDICPTSKSNICIFFGAKKLIGTKDISWLKKANIFGPKINLK